MDKYDKQHDKNVAYYRAQIDAIYKEAAREAALIGCSLSKVNPDRPFSFADYPVTKKRLDKLLSELSRNLSTAIVDGVKSEWTLANKKNSELCRQVFGDDIDNLTDEQRSRYFSPREQARDAFIARKENGLALSDRVWKYTDQFKNEIELGLDCGIRAGTPAPKMTQELQGYLRNPDKLFRRVRDERGVLHLSKAAADYHPGRGVYRSSYKNSLRLAGSETNIAYRTADYLASQDQDFVVGIRIEPSKTNHTIKDAKGKPVRFKDICDDLAGDYPKDFKFVGWHPNCRCHVLKIQKTIEEMKEDNRRIMEGKEPTKVSSREVKELPQSFREWVGNNSERIASAKQLPYFIRDNKAAVDNIIDRANIEVAKDAIELALGITKGQPMTFEQANEMRANPHYCEDESYRINCQTCVVANEMRRRGYDVEAFGNIGDNCLSAYISRHTNAVWLDEMGNIPQLSRAGGEVRDANGNYIFKNGSFKTKTVKQRQKEFEQLTREPGRYHVGMIWSGKREGHIITVERHEDGSLTSYDPQNGRKGIFGEYMKKVSPSKALIVLRVDNLHANPVVLKGLLKSTGSTLPTPKADAALIEELNAKLGSQGARNKIGKTLQKQERDEIRRKAEIWVKENLPITKLRDGNDARRAIIQIKNEKEIIINKRSFEEIYAKNIKNEDLSSVMEIARNFNVWLPTARFVRTEYGIHHDFDFNVYEANFNGKTIEIKTKLVNEEILYNIRIL